MVINFDGGGNGTKLIREYKNFLERVIKNNEIWILFEDGRVAVVETEEGTCVPLWSTPEGAEANREDDWVKFEVQKMSPAEFVTLCIPDLEEGNIDAIVEMKMAPGYIRNFLPWKKICMKKQIISPLTLMRCAWNSRISWMRTKCMRTSLRTPSKKDFCGS